MNKAFCKEPDAAEPALCPACGREGLAVAIETIRCHADPEAAESLGEPAYFCVTDTCAVAYFDLLERSIAADAARDLFWPKDPAGPLCSCHGLSLDDVDADIADGVPTRLREAVRKAGEPGAPCATRSADGRPCVARLQKYFLRRRAELGGGLGKSEDGTG
jgi:hypothetical protein